MQGALQIISDAPTLQQHIIDRQAVYRSDIVRYPAYFDDHTTNRIWAKPSILSETSATATLRNNLLNLTADVISLHRLPLPRTDLARIASELANIEALLRQFPELGVTMSLFERQGIGLSGIGTSHSMGRLLSLLHLRHYLDISGSDIVTGLPCLYAFDGLSRAFPLYDSRIFATIANLVGLPAKPYVDQSLFEGAAGLHSGPLHLALVHATRALIAGALYAAANNNTSMSEGRSRVIAFLQQLDPGKIYASSRGPRLESYVGAIHDLIIRAEGLSDRFREYMTMLTAVDRIRPGRVLLVCAADVEVDAALRIATDRMGSTYSYSRNPVDANTIHSLGYFGGSPIYLCQMEAGDEGVSSLRLAMQEVISALHPDFVILAGVCYGLRPDKQSIGTIVVSKQVQAFNLRRRTARGCGESAITLRGPKAEASPTLLDRSRAARVTWQRCTVEHELYMSGSVLSDDPRFVEELLLLQPEARAGEMEGHGIYSSCARAKVDWIIIKAICDWGMGKTGDHQTLAAANALEYVFHIIGQGGLVVSRM